MCISNAYYPLVEIKETLKRKILFNYPYYVNCIQDLQALKNVGNQFILASSGISIFTRINNECVLNGYKFVKFVKVPCGFCSECLNQISREWALRISKEAQKWTDNHFITFTYDEEHNPRNLDKTAISQFNKRLKSKLKYNNINNLFRFYAVGEYGSHTFRPHYHGIYFNLQLPDLKFYGTTKNGDILYTSDIVSSCWNFGQVLIGSVTPSSAAYVARYCDKKKRLTPNEKKYYKSLGLQPEFSIMSNRPGIGADYLNEIKSLNDIDNIFINGQRYLLPKYYDRKLKELLSGDDLALYERKRQMRSDILVSNRLFMSEALRLPLSSTIIDDYKKRRENL